MKRIFVMLALLAFSAAAFAQARGELPTIAIRTKSYDGVPTDIKILIEEKLYEAFVNEGLFKRTERREEELAFYDEEQAFESNSQYVDEGDSRGYGKIEGADFLCNATIKRLEFNGSVTYLVSASVNTKKGLGEAGGSERTALSGADPWREAETVTLKIVRKMSDKIKADRNVKEQAAREEKFKGEKDTYPDSRDGKKYRYWDRGRGKKWFLRDLQLYGKTTYTWDDALNACYVQGGWRLPTKADWVELKSRMDGNDDLKKAFYEYWDGKSYWWSSDYNHCEDYIKGRNCEFKDDPTKPPTFMGTETKKVLVDEKKQKYETRNYNKYEYPKIQPAIRCVKD